MWVLRDAATVVPSARRQRIAGESAYRNGDLDTAKELLQKATKATKGSVIAQAQDTLLLAQTLVDLGESGDAVKLLKEAVRFWIQNHEESETTSKYAHLYHRLGTAAGNP